LRKRGMKRLERREGRGKKEKIMEKITPGLTGRGGLRGVYWLLTKLVVVIERRIEKNKRGEKDAEIPRGSGTQKNKGSGEPLKEGGEGSTQPQGEVTSIKKESTKGGVGGRA